MKVMLTSFGISTQGGPNIPTNAIFYRMPPVDTRFTQANFMPDYAVLLLCEKLVVDKTSFHILEQGHREHWHFNNITQTILTLHAEGFIELADFDAILSRKKQLLEKMVDSDLKTLEQWVNPLRESLGSWRQFASFFSHLVELNREHVQPTTRLGYSVPLHSLGAASQSERELTRLLDESLNSARIRRESSHRAVLRETLKGHLRYVNANLILSNELDTGFHDWADFAPFYRQKFLSIGRERSNEEAGGDVCRQLLNCFCPNLENMDAKSLVRFLKDSRIQDLRKVVQDALETGAVLDSKFVELVLRDVIRTEQSVAAYRKFLSYVTLPLELIPGVGTAVQKTVEEIAALAVERNLQKKHRWFYFVSDISKSLQKIH